MNNPPQTVIAVFAALPKAAHDARAFTARVLDSWGMPDLAETATLLVSELVTNSVQHAGGIIDPPGDRAELIGKIPPVILGLSYLAPILRVQVWDASQQPPLHRKAASDAESGRGLELVDALSKEWGCEVLTTGGKITWLALETGCL